MPRTLFEAALLQAVSNDNAEEVSSALKMAEEEDLVAVRELLELRVKPTFNNPNNPKAFFHSVASFGLDFALDESITQLAQRNEKMEAFQVLDALEKRLFGTSSAAVPRDLAGEAQLLTAVSKDDGAAVTKVLEAANGEALLKLTVEKTFKDATGSAFYHSVASYHLAFELGDTIHDLAVRNGKTQAAESLASFGRPADVKVEVLVTNAVNGQELCRVSASSSWTMLQLAHDVASQVPTPGCRIFLLGGAALTSGTTLADVMKEREGDSDILELSSLVRSNVAGVYSATVTREEDELELLGPRLVGGGRRLIGRPRGQVPPQQLQVELKEDGTASFEYSVHPVDRGHCAPPSGGRLIKGTGQWQFEASNLELSITAGDTGHFQRCMPHRDGPLSPFVIILTMVKEDQLDVVDMNPLDSSAAPSPRGRHFHRCCPRGTAFLKRGEGEEVGSLVHFMT